MHQSESQGHRSEVLVARMRTRGLLTVMQLSEGGEDQRLTDYSKLN